MLSTSSDQSSSTIKRLPHSISLLNLGSNTFKTEFKVSKSFSNAQVSYGRQRRRSLNEKLMAKEDEQNRSFCFCFSLRIVILLSVTLFLLFEFYENRFISFIIPNFNSIPLETTAVPQRRNTYYESDYPSHMFPSLNVLDYWDYAYPVFPDRFPLGISRKNMPQVLSTFESEIWQRFEDEIKQNGGQIVLHNNLDLRLAKPLQSQVSGNVLYNIVFETLKEEVSKDFFKSRIVLIKSSRRERQNSGGLFPINTYFILDGHHTTFATTLCATPQTKLRLGNLYKGSKLCGKDFDTKQDILVIEGLGLLEVREIAIASGASTGHGLSYPSNYNVTLT